MSSTAFFHRAVKSGAEKPFVRDTQPYVWLYTGIYPRSSVSVCTYLIDIINVAKYVRVDHHAPATDRYRLTVLPMDRQLFEWYFWNKPLHF